MEPQPIDADWLLALLAVAKVRAIADLQRVTYAHELLLFAGQAGQCHLLHLDCVHATEPTDGLIQLYWLALIRRHREPFLQVGCELFQLLSDLSALGISHGHVAIIQRPWLCVSDSHGQEELTFVDFARSEGSRVRRLYAAGRVGPLPAGTSW